MRTDIEVREIEPTRQPVGDINLFPEIEPGTPIPGSTLDLQRQRAAQAQQSSEYELYRISDGRSVTAPAGNPIVFRADSPEDAESKIARYAADFNLGAPELFAVRSVLQVPDQTNPLTPTGPGPWEVANRENNQVYYNPGHTNRAAAETEARTWLTQNGHNPDYFEVRTRETASNRDAAQGGIIDVATDQPTQAPRTLTTPGQGQQVWTGEWKVVDANGQELYRFSGVGNNQADANRVAAQWAQRNMVRDEVNVVPVMGPA